MIFFFSVSPKLSGPNGTFYIQEFGLGKVFSFDVVDVNPPVDGFQWLVDGATPLTGERITSSVSRTSLEIESPRRWDSGNYSVSAFGPSGNDSMEFQLIVMCKKKQ